MERNTQKNGMVNMLGLLVACVVAAVIGKIAQSATSAVGAVFLGTGFLVAAISYFQMRLENREQLEKMEFEEIAKDRNRSALFEESGEDTFLARKAREQFERFFVPTFTALLGIGQAVAAYMLWNWLPDALQPDLGKAPIVMVSFAALALILFMVGKYSAGVARMEKLRLLRPGGAYLLLGSVICVVVVISFAGGWFEFTKLDKLLAQIMVILLGLSTLETFVNLILEIYRPRTKAKAERTLYESRLVGLLGQPAGLVTTAAQALDYQFGFKVSDTWFYKFLEKALAWLVLFQLGMLMLSTTFVIIDPNELGLLERFGKPRTSGAVLEPGLHFKLPWPMDKVYRHPAKELRSFNVGYEMYATPEGEDDHGDGGRSNDQQRTLLWTASHYDEELNFLVASSEQLSSGDDSGDSQAVPVNFLTAAVPVQYIVKDFEAWYYNHTDPATLLKSIGNREVVRYLVNVDLIEIMSTGRLAAAEALKNNIQDRADNLGLGVEIIFVGLQDIHPPVGDKMTPVAASFEDVIGAEQEMEAKILAAEGYAAEIVPKSRGEAAELVAAAQGANYERILTSEARAKQFKDMMIAYDSAPDVFKQRKYYDTIANSLTNVRKYIIGPEQVDETFMLNLEDNIRYDLLDARPEER
ncbi:MAG: protease modulator HflK [Verrucomicrobia bacterium]|nr:protease modulator HflK [Verrucomicrobiota bacterium]